ncbi:MAG: outer membrane protein OmpA-like peptidoglycan-associated protein [Bacteriovoracaceae bacterium]|jgi:outer membrane protein OmpA-like peptidoglycan-associated protein
MFFLSINAYANNNHSLWGYAGFHLGPANLESDVDDEAGQKLGNQVGLQLSGLYNTDNWAINSSLNWFELNYESETISGRKVELSTRSFSVDVSPLWKPHNRWYLGPKLSYIIGDEVIVGPGTGNTTAKMAGLNVFYEIPWKSFKIRNGFHFQQVLDIGNRSSKIILYSLELGQLFLQNDKDYVVTKNTFLKKSSQTIQLDEQIINFQSGSTKLTESSHDFLISLGSTLRDITNDWEILKVEGHTDTTGSAAVNLKVSQKRVQSVINALVEGGAPVERISGEAFGESIPLVNEATPEAHARNRRVELRFLGETNKEKLKTILDDILEH